MNIKVHLYWLISCHGHRSRFILFNQYSYTDQVLAKLAHQSAILLALAGARAYIYSRDVALDHVVLVAGFAIVFGTQRYSTHAYLRHWTLASTTWYHSPNIQIGMTETFYNIAIAYCAEGLALQCLVSTVLQIKCLLCIWVKTDSHIQPIATATSHKIQYRSEHYTSSMNT